jgi:hypothetical protein
MAISGRNYFVPYCSRFVSVRYVYEVSELFATEQVRAYRALRELDSPLRGSPVPAALGGIESEVKMSRLRVESFSVSLDGFGAGPDQSLDNPLGVGGTTFHFVTGGIHEALDRARQAAGGKDIRLSGGVDTVRQYLLAGLVDELHIAISPALH